MIWMPPWRARSQTFLVWRLRSPASRSNSRSSLWMYTYIHTYIHAHVSLQIGDITRFIAILIGNMMTIIHWKWGCPTFTAIFWHAAVDETRRPLNQKKHVHINIHTMICYVLKSSDDEWCIFFWSPRRFAWCGLVNISDQKSCVASAALNCNQEATDSKPPPGDWAPYISHVYIYNMVIMCIFLSFFFFFFLSFIFLSVYIYTRVSTDLSLYNTTETSPSDRFRNEAPAPRRATWESSLCLQQWPLGDSGPGVSIVMGAPQKWMVYFMENPTTNR